MYIKRLKISSEDGVIREICFHKGLNLIIDETPSDDKRKTGNNVGKTSVLRLINFCLGGDGKEVYTDEERGKDEYEKVKSFLINKKVLIELMLTEDLDDESAREIKIERNFLSRKGAIRRINGEDVAEKNFVERLKSLIFPEHGAEVPTFRQIISHNIRYRNEGVNNTLKTLNRFTKDTEYESLYLYLLGCRFSEGERRQELLSSLRQENEYRRRLENGQSKNLYVMKKNALEYEVSELEWRRNALNVNVDFERDLERLNEVRMQINKSSSQLNRLFMRLDMILDAQKNMESKKSKVDLEALKLLYSHAKQSIRDLQQSFEALVEFHDKMIDEKVSFLTEEIPSLKEQIGEEERSLSMLLNEERVLAEKIAKSDSFEDILEIESVIKEKSRVIGQYEKIIHLLSEVDEKIDAIQKELDSIDDDLFSPEFEEEVKNQIIKFNRYFSKVSEALYGERYALSYEIVRNKRQERLYQFSAFNLNMGSGKKQGEILCFDLAYILFAEEENIRCLHFLLNDKKELMHGHQLLKVAEFVEENGIQLVVSILKDKLPEGILDKAKIVVSLSQDCKLFKIERSCGE